MRGLSFIVDGELYAVDVTLVQKVARKLAITPVPSAPEEIIGIANLKGRVVTVLSLTKLLGATGHTHENLYINTIVFKSSASNEDQMGLAIEKPGNLINIGENAIHAPNAAQGAANDFCISGVTEIGDSFYRIIDIEAIEKKYVISDSTHVTI